MSQENVELYCQAIDAFNRRDLEAFLAPAVRTRGHGAGSETPLDQRMWQVGRWHRGKCVWRETFETKAEALEAVSLSE